MMVGTWVTNLLFITLKIVATVTITFLGSRLLFRDRTKKYHPIVGTVFHQLLNFKRIHDYISDLAAKYKTFRFIDPFRSSIYTTDPANVEYILKTNFDNYGKGIYNYENLSGLLGDGIFAVDGDKWRNQRKISSYEFSTRVLRDFSSKIFQKNAGKLATIISDAAKSNQIIDIQDLFMRSTLDSIFKVAFGVDLDTTCGSDEGARFSQAFDDASAMSAYRFVDIFWKIKRFLNIGREAKLKKNVKFVDNFVYKVINNKAELVKKSQNDLFNVKEENVKKEDILSRFLQHGTADPKYLRDIILNFVIAGKDTTAATLSWFIYMLCKHPKIQERVAEEVRKVTKIKEAENYEEFANRLSEDLLDNMHYLHATLTETLRLYPAVPSDAKACLSDDTLPDGYSVKKGDKVAYHPYAMGRMKYIWGDHAEEFRPERWLNDDGIFQPESPFKFTAFQGGPRICLGKDFAYRQMKIFSTVLLSNFIFKLFEEKNTVEYRTMLTLHINGGLFIRVIHRE